ncbi:MAG: efflux RND transporter permease subunit [Proteobacteria bacterium]|nr:efflux RND transporter permease subunit [Pseudomonadota bacterium]
MAQNPVAANLIMLAFLIGGALIVSQVKQEVEPDFEVGWVRVSVPFPGASPDEVEKGIILAIEETVSGMDGVKRVESSAYDEMASVNIELSNEADINKLTENIKNAVDRITSFPQDAERPLVRSVTTGREVLGMIIFGDQDEKVLRHYAETVRLDLLREPNITKIELTGIRPLEISVEVPQENLRTYGLTLEGIAGEIRRSAVEVPGGGVKTDGGEILLRTTERREIGREFEDLTILSTGDGTRVRLGDISTIRDAFEDVDRGGFFNGKPSVWIRVFCVGEQKPLEVARTVKEYQKRLNKVLPQGIESSVFYDTTEEFHATIDLLKQNGFVGLCLVMLILGLILELRLAFWVTMGIPISFLGSFIFLPSLDVSINMYSLFGLIVTLGMVVDDAIIIGENIYFHRQEGEKPIDAAISGASEVAVPVVFSILTTIVAFSPMLFLPGLWGKYFRILPSVIITVLLISLLESLLILPAHLGHLREVLDRSFIGRINLIQGFFGRALNKFAHSVYGPLVRFTTRHHWITSATAIAFLFIVVGIVQGNRIGVEFFPKTESFVVTAFATLPFGAPLSETKRVQKHIEMAARRVKDKPGKASSSNVIRSIFTYVDASHRINVYALLTKAEVREISASEFVDKWREEIGVMTEMESLQLNAIFGGPTGETKDIDFQLSHKDIHLLKKAASELARILANYNGVNDIDDGYSSGKPQLNFTLNPEADSLGVTAEILGRQLRSAFWGVEALRQQRGRDMLRVVVRLPARERTSEHDINELIIQTPEHGEIPISRAANLTRGISYNEINRTDGQRTVHVTANVIEELANARQIIASIEKTELAALKERYRGLNFVFGGMERMGLEAVDTLFQGFAIALLVMFVLIAIPFNSYIQPVIVLSAIPFGLVGAVLGHMAMGYVLSIVSLMGMVALSGVVVNDSLVLVYTANRFAASGLSNYEAITNAGIRRFRPILLTSATTFLGLTPMIFETSIFAKYVIPMAISIGFGVLFATIIILLIVPSFFLIVEDIKEFFSEMAGDVGSILRWIRGFR